MAKVKIPTVKLNNGDEMPVLGYGTWMGFDENSRFLSEGIPAMVEALEYAIDIGYRHIDTAHLYRVEPEIGEVIQKKIKEGVVKREELFITTKVWNHNHREADVEKSVRDSLKRMKLDYLDQVLLHWPMSISVDGVDEKIDYLETWRGFETVLKKGLTKTIGVSNFNIEQLKRLIANSKTVPSTNQVEINITFMQKPLREYCATHNIVMVAYAPFGSVVPTRATTGSPEPRIDNPIMVAMAKKYGKTVLQIVLRYLYQNNIVSIPKTNTKSRVLENASIFDFTIDDGDLAALAKFDVNYRTVHLLSWQFYTNYPFETKPVDGGPIPESLLRWKNGIKEDID